MIMAFNDIRCHLIADFFARSKINSYICGSEMKNRNLPMKHCV